MSDSFKAQMQALLGSDQRIMLATAACGLVAIVALSMHLFGGKAVEPPMPSAQPFMSKKSKPKPKKKAAAQTAKKAPAAKAKNVVAAVASDDDDSDAENYQRKKNKAKPETAEARMKREDEEHAAMMKASFEVPANSKKKRNKKGGGGSGGGGGGGGSGGGGLTKAEADDGWETASKPKKQSGGAKKKSAQSSQNADPYAECKEFVTVEARKIGIIIGPGGATIKAVMEASGARVDMPERDRESTAPAKIMVSGPGVAVKAAKAAVTELATKGYCTLIQEKGFEEGSVMVPPSQLNELIGKQGAVIRKIEEAMQVKLSIPRTDGAPMRGGSVGLVQPKPVKVGLAGSKEAVAEAKLVIKSIIKFHHHEKIHPGKVHVSMDVPTAYFSYIIGTKGAEMRHINANFGVELYLPGRDSQTDYVLVVGSAANCARAKDYIFKLMQKADEKPNRQEDDQW